MAMKRIEDREAERARLDAERVEKGEPRLTPTEFLEAWRGRPADPPPPRSMELNPTATIACPDPAARLAGVSVLVLDKEAPGTSYGCQFLNLNTRSPPGSSGPRGTSETPRRRRRNPPRVSGGRGNRRRRGRGAGDPPGGPS